MRAMLPSAGPAGLAMLLLLAIAPAVRADKIPDWLPHYDLGIQLDTDRHKVTVQERVTWHNRHARPSDELVFSAYPRYKIPDDEIVLIAKTLELLRAPPKEGIDSVGRRLQVQRVTLEGKELPFHWSEQMQTALHVSLPKAVKQGESVTVEIEFMLDLPTMQGRWGHWKGVTFLANWYPVLAYYDDGGWQPTPFVAWHQPFFNEAGVYSVRLTLPKDQKIASTGTIREEEDHGNGLKTAHIVGCCARDFALVCSDRFQELTAKAGHVNVRVLTFPEHADLAKKALEFACEVIPLYGRWFGKYPYDEFDIVESHFPWNGNECSGMVMIDERVFNMPRMAEMYVDHLITHETMHQWWYNIVGTNGYCETWMDEGVVSFFTARRLQQKYGHNACLIRYPRGLQWLPNIHHEDYRFYGMYGTLGRKEETLTIQPLPEFGHLITLFSMTYDRGAKILGMIEERIGTDAFIDFMRLVYAKYQFHILRVADFQKELEHYTGRCWKEFFDHWLYSKGMTDWAVDRVRVKECEITKEGPRKRSFLPLFHSSTLPSYQVEVVLKQHEAFLEPTTLGVKFDKKGPYELRIPIDPGVCEVTLDNPPTTIENQPDGSVRVVMLLPVRPAQITVDPDQILVDREPANNHWKPEINWRHPWVFTPLEQTALTAPYDRWSIITGLWGDQLGHLGVGIGAYRLEHFKGGVYLAYDVNDQDIVVGSNAVVDHWPFPYTQVGVVFDHSLVPSLADTRRDRGRIFGRYIFHYTPSLYLEPMEFVEIYARVDNEFWRDHPPFKTGIESYDDESAVGIAYHRDYRTPYWDPDVGYRFDAYYENGGTFLGGDDSYNRIAAEFSVVKGLPGGLGYLSETRLAARVLGGLGWPQNGEHFQLGGSLRLRGLERADRQGSAIWIASLEWRFPIWKNINYNVCDRVAEWKHLYGAIFYDVGDVYLNDHEVGSIAHSFGIGLRFDVAWFSFIERTTLRLDAAKVVNDNTPIQFWFGLQQAF